MENEDFKNRKHFFIKKKKNKKRGKQEPLLLLLLAHHIKEKEHPTHHKQLFAPHHIPRTPHPKRRMILPDRPIHIRLTTMIKQREKRAHTFMHGVRPAIILDPSCQREQHPGIVRRVGEDVNAELLETFVWNDDVVVEGE